MTHEELHTFYSNYIEVLNTRQFDRLSEFVNDEITYFGFTATRDQVIAAIRAEVEAVPDLTWELKDFGTHGDDLAARLLNRGTPVKAWLGVDPTGTSFEILEFAVYKVKDGRFTHMSNVQDSSTLAPQLAR